MKAPGEACERAGASPAPTKGTEDNGGVRDEDRRGVLLSESPGCIAGNCDTDDSACIGVIVDGTSVAVTSPFDSGLFPETAAQTPTCSPYAFDVECSRLSMTTTGSSSLDGNGEGGAWGTRVDRTGDTLAGLGVSDERLSFPNTDKRFLIVPSIPIFDRLGVRCSANLDCDCF